MGITHRELYRSLFLVAIVVVMLSLAQPVLAEDDPASLLWPKPREVRQTPETHLLLPIRIVAPAELHAPSALLQKAVDRIFGAAQKRPEGTVIRLSLTPEALTRPEEYAVASVNGEVSLRAHDPQGMFWAVHILVTLFEQAQPDADGYTIAIPAIRDWPEVSFRSLMFQGAWVPTLEDYRRTLELMARMHITYFALEFGPQVVLDFDPTIATGGRFSKADARAVIEYGRSLGLQPIAYLNMLGHLDRAYQKEPYTQHGGIDIRNDETYDKFVYPILSEMLEVYGPVEYFHCGMDEAWELFTWLSEQGEDVTGLITKHIARVNAFLKARGVKTVIWHDMLIDRNLRDVIGGPAGPANGGPPQNTAKALTMIPKDVVLDYWFYDPLPAYPALDYLRSQGFEVWASPWETPFSFVRYAQERHAPTLGTLWTGPPDCFGSLQSNTIIAFYAQAAWNAGAAGSEVQPEPALQQAAQRATNAMLWHRPTLTLPGEHVFILRPEGTRLATASDPRYYGVPLASASPVTIEPLPGESKALATPTQAARVRFPGGAEVALDGVNTDRGRRQMILYAAPREKTGTNGWGCEVRLDAQGKVQEIYADDSGDHAIPPDGFILSASGGRGKSAPLRELRLGDQVTILDAQGQWIGGAEPLQLYLELSGGNTLPLRENQPREAGQVVLYHPGYGEGKTQTTEPGVEVVVRNGRVVGIAVSDNASSTEIPTDGYVLSTARGEDNPYADALIALQPGDTMQLIVEKGGRRRHLDRLLARRSKQFPVQAKCDALYLALRSNRRCAPGTPLGEWQIRYTDNSVEQVAVRYGYEALSSEAEALPVTLADTIWLVDNPSARFLVREWRNPHPEKEINEIVFVPAQAVLEVGAQILAATVVTE